jgi:hypothetical protein
VNAAYVQLLQLLLLLIGHEYAAFTLCNVLACLPSRIHHWLTRPILVVVPPTCPPCSDLVLLLPLFFSCCCCRPLICCLSLKSHSPEAVKEMLAVVQEHKLL